MTTLENWISRACNVLGLHADFAFVVEVGSGHEVRAIARIRNLGAINGMLVFLNYDDIRPYVDELLQAGYGYAVLDEPRANEAFDLDSFKEMFLDWGWSGPGALMPPKLR